MTALALAFTFTGCAVDDPTTDDPATPTETDTTPVELVSSNGSHDTVPVALQQLTAENSGTVPGTSCTIKSELNSVGFGNWQAIGGVSCGMKRTERVQVCVDWLVTGGWQTVWCQDSGYVYAYWDESHITFNPLSYSARYYRTRTWVSADGNVDALYSASKYLGTVPI